MRFAIFSVSLSICIAITPPATGGGDKGPLKKLQGDWELTELRINGVSMPKDRTENALVTFFDGNKMRIIPNTKVRSIPKNFMIKLGTNEMFSTIDMTIVDEGKYKDKVLKGIYELKGDKLKICSANNPEALRPTEMTSPKGLNRALLVLTRKAPPKKAEPKKEKNKKKNDKKKKSS